jgi:hypothetical protein
VRVVVRGDLVPAFAAPDMVAEEDTDTLLALLLGRTPGTALAQLDTAKDPAESSSPARSLLRALPLGDGWRVVVLVGLS